MSSEHRTRARFGCHGSRGGRIREGNGPLDSKRTMWLGFLASLHLMVTTDLFLHNENIGHFQVFLKSQEVEMKIRGPESLFN